MKGKIRKQIKKHNSYVLITLFILFSSIILNNNFDRKIIHTKTEIPLATEISENEATQNGGGINNQGSIIMEDGSVDNNSATNGGGLYNNGESTLLGGQIAENDASNDGGGVHNGSVGIVNTEERLLIKGSEFNKLIGESVNLIIFTDEKAPDGAELTNASEYLDNGIVTWTTDEGTMYVSTQKKNAKIYANPDSSVMFMDKNNIQAFDFTNLDTTKVLTMQRMFANTSAPYVDISSFKTPNCTDFSGLFLSANNVLKVNLTGLDTSKATTVRFMFGGNGSADTEIMNLQEVIGSETLRFNDCTNFQSMFNQCSSLKYLDTKDWGVNKATTTYSMFYNCYELKGVDVSKWKTPNLTEAGWTFYKCESLESLDISGWDMTHVTRTKSMFAYCKSLKTLNVSGIQMPENLDSSYMFSSLYLVTELDVNNFNMKKVENIQGMFQYSYNIQELEILGWNTYNLKKITSAFSLAEPLDTGYTGVSNLRYLDVSGIITDNVTDMGFTFYGLRSLPYIDLSHFKTSNVTSMHHMFAHCNNLVISGYENWDVSNVEYMNALFHTTATPIYDISTWNTSKCKSFGQMFEATKTVEIIGIENIDTSNAKHFYEMFNQCKFIKKLNIPNIDTRKASDSFIDEIRNAPYDSMSNMFAGMILLEEITLGENFSFNGNGNCSVNAVFPTPLPEKITGADGHWYNEETSDKYTPEEVPSYKAATYIAVNPKANLEIFENPDGSTGGVYEPPADEPDIPEEIPEENLPELIEFEFGEFEAVTDYTPGEYEEVEYTYTYTKNILPVSYQSILWSKWMITKDANGNVISTVPYEIKLDDINRTYSNYIIYNFETTEALYENGVAGDSVKIYQIYDSDDDNEDNAIYLAAYINKLEGTKNNHVAQLVNGKYTDAGLDNKVNSINKFTETYTQTYTKTVEIKKPLSSTEYVYIPIGNMKAEIDMTWSEWLVSDYNTTGKTDVTIMTSNYEEVSLDTEIDPNKSYGFGIASTYQDGLFDSTGKQLASWDELVNDYGLSIDDYNEMDYGEDNRLYNILNNNTELNNGNKLIISETVTKIGNNALRFLPLNEIYIPNSVKSIGDWAFSGTDITEIIIPDSVTSLGEDAFCSCNNLIYAEIGNGITELSYEVFNDCANLLQVKLPDSLEIIGYAAFKKCSNLNSIEIPSSVKIIDCESFRECYQLTNVKMSDGLESIEIEAFSECCSLQTLVIPSTVTNIGDEAFYNNTSLESVYFEQTTAIEFGEHCFLKWSGIKTTFYFKDKTIALQLKDENKSPAMYHYSSSYGTKSTDYNW